MATNWEECTLGNAITLQRGFDLPKYNRTLGRFPLISSSGISDYHSEAKVTAPGVVTGRYGTIGQVFYVEQDFWPLNTTLYVKDFKGNNPLFISYLLRTVDFASCSDKSSVPGVNRNDLHLIKILLPPIAEQKAIAQILSSLDDKIELNQQMNQTLEAIARALFKSWFIDFDPVRAKMDDRQPVGMDAETAALFPAEFEDSAIGKIPKGWKLGRLENIAEIIMGASPKGDTYNEIGVGTPLVNGPVEFGDYFLVEKKWTTAPTRLSKAGDLIFCVRGSTTGRRVISDGVYCLGRGVCAIRGIKDAQIFINQMIELELERLLAKTTGSVFPNLGSSDLREFIVMMPSYSLIERFCITTQALTHQIWLNVHQSRSLAEIRDRLLPKLLSGELHVKDAEKTVEKSE